MGNSPSTETHHRHAHLCDDEPMWDTRCISPHGHVLVGETTRCDAFPKEMRAEVLMHRRQLKELIDAMMVCKARNLKLYNTLALTREQSMQMRQEIEQCEETMMKMCREIQYLKEQYGQRIHDHNAHAEVRDLFDKLHNHLQESRREMDEAHRGMHKDMNEAHANAKTHRDEILKVLKELLESTRKESKRLGERPSEPQKQETPSAPQRPLTFNPDGQYAPQRPLPFNPNRQYNENSVSKTRPFFPYPDFSRRHARHKFNPNQLEPIFENEEEARRAGQNALQVLADASLGQEMYREDAERILQFLGCRVPDYL